MAGSITFERAAHFYDQTRSFPPGADAQAADLIRRVGGFAPTDRVLEIGVGTGRIALPLSKHVQAIMGVDLARPMMERLRAKQQDERVLLAEGDATRLPLASDVFDGAVAVHVFHLIPNWQQAAREVARTLRPGARLVHAWSENFHRETWWNGWNNAIRQPDREHSGIRFSQYRRFLVDEGWRPVGDEGAFDYTYQQRPQEFLDQLEQRIWSSTWHLSEDELARGIAIVRDALLREHGALDMPVEVRVGFFAQAYLPPQA